MSDNASKAAATGSHLTVADAPDPVAEFLTLSALLTGFDESTLQGTGLVRPYYDTLLTIIGPRELGRLLSAFDALGPDKDLGEPLAEDAFRTELFDDAVFGPILRNIVYLWYLGQWNQLPGAWRDARGATAFDTDHVISAAGYRESLVWVAAGAHPMGAKAPGHGSWAAPPISAERGGRRHE